MVRRTPQQFGYQRNRWRLDLLLACCPWLRLTSLPGLWQVLQRLGISYQRGRDYIHSPDSNYRAKCDLIEQCRLRAWYAPDRYAFLYLDEVTFYRQPSLSDTYALPTEQPLAYRSQRSDASARVLGALNALTGAVHYRQRTRITTTTLRDFWFDLRQAHPTVETLYVVVDNWPVHFHPEVLAPLQPQRFPFPPTLPASWSSLATRSSRQEALPIQLLCLPTYASWLNPIEKLWRWLRQDRLHLHRLADDWDTLKQSVTSFLDQFAHGSDALLQYVGLLPN